MIGDSVITLLAAAGGRVRLGIEAPVGVSILRAELSGQAETCEKPLTKTSDQPARPTTQPGS